MKKLTQATFCRTQQLLRPVIQINFNGKSSLYLPFKEGKTLQKLRLFLNITFGWIGLLPVVNRYMPHPSDQMTLSLLSNFGR